MDYCGSCGEYLEPVVDSCYQKSSRMMQLCSDCREKMYSVFIPEETEQEAFEKYGLLLYYYQTEEFDRLICGEDGKPKDGEQMAACGKNARQIARQLNVSWRYKKDFGHWGHERVKEEMKWYEKKYPHFYGWSGGAKPTI